MRTLQQSVARKEMHGEPLPTRFETMRKAGMIFRRGQTVLIAGQPGSGKTLLALDLAVHSHVPTLYMSADSDEITVTSRCAAMVLEQLVSITEHQLNEGDNAQILDALQTLSHIRFCYDTAPTLDDVNLELRAYIEIFGDTPHLIVFDNLMNITSDHDNEWRGLKETMEALRQLARIANACVIILHHTSENDGDPTEPPARRAVIGKVNQAPELILTVANDPKFWEYKIAAVKNRSGEADPSANKHVTLMVDLPRMMLSELGT